MKLCSPEGYPLLISVQAVDRPRSLEGLRIGFLDNTKAPVDKLMPHIGRRLSERVPGIQLYFTSKKSMGVPAGPVVMEALRQNCDVLINAMGD